MTILIIDDDDIVRLSLLRAFEMFNHKVFVAASGEEGLKLWAKDQPDVVLVDALMPNLSGFEVLEKAPKSKSFNIMISAFTGANEKDIESSRAHCFIAKPFENIFETVKTIETMYENYCRKI